MATSKQKSAALDKWSCEFPELAPIDKYTLAKRSGHLITGICLDGMRDKTIYQPRFFCHNLLVPFPIVSLSYNVPLLDNNGVPQPVKYDAEVSDFAKDLTTNLCLAEAQTFSIFWKHVNNAIKGKYGYGPLATYLPHAVKDLITLNSIRVSQHESLDILEKALLYLESKGNVNFNISGSASEWRQEVEGLIKSEQSELAQENAIALKLDSLEIHPFKYDNVENFWEL